MKSYPDFLASKKWGQPPIGFEVEDPHAAMMPFQKDIVKWALRRGRSACFADCGMGKTLMQLVWAHHVARHTGHPVLVIAPLAVAKQTEKEAEKFGIPSAVVSRDGGVPPGAQIVITNYEMVDKFDAGKFSGVVIDESSILKSYSGATRTMLIEKFIATRFKFACTATPAPNDFMELGNHAEFLGVMKRNEMLSMFFINDMATTGEWRLKGHAEDDFWKWVCGWAVMVRKPSDMGHSDDGFILPELRMHQVTVESGHASDGLLFAVEAVTLDERRAARRASQHNRVEACALLANGSKDPWIVWCDMNAEGDALESQIDGAVQVSGADSLDEKSDRMHAFSDGKARVLVSKPSIAGWGMNWQHCSNVAFVGLSDSYEQFYQAVRRCWRFGQTKPVDCYVITSVAEGNVVKNIQRKESAAQKMADNMVSHMRTEMNRSVHGTSRDTTEYKPTKKMSKPAWLAGSAS